MGLFRKKRTIPEPVALDRRRAERIRERRAMLVIDDVSYGVIDWSVGGFRVLGYQGGYRHGTEARARLIIVDNGLPTHFDATIRVLRENPAAGELAGEFISMSADTRKGLERVYRRRLARQQERTRSRENT